MLLVFQRERVLAEWIDLAYTDMLDGVMTRSAFFLASNIRGTLFHASEGAFINTLDKLVLSLHIRVGLITL